MIKNTKWLKQWMWVISLCVLCISPVQAASEAGQVLMVAGEASAKGSDGQARQLSRRSPVYVGDTITTGTKSQAQLRMKDGAMIALGESAEFGVQSYAYKKAGDGKDSAVLSLVKGGLRTVSGQIEKSAYKMQTPTATLGIRGTSFDVHVAADGTTTVILRDGEVDVTGAGKTVRLIAPGLATIVKDGQVPSEPGEPPQEVLDYLRGLLGSLPEKVTWEKNEKGDIIFHIGDDLVMNIINDQPPGINGDGDPDTQSYWVCEICECVTCNWK